MGRKTLPSSFYHLCSPRSHYMPPSHLFIRALTPRFFRDFRWTFHSAELHRRIIGVFEPIEPEVASRLQVFRQLTAFGFAIDSSVSFTPSVIRSAPLRRAPIEDSQTTTRHLQIEMILTQITSGIDRLNHESLALCRTIGEIQSVARAANFSFRFPTEVDSGETIGQVIIDGPWLIGVAHETRTTLATAFGILVNRGLSILLARGHGRCDWSFSTPTAAHFAAIPVTSGFSGSFRTDRF